MKLYKDKAIILKIVQLKEADKLVILLTQQNGIVETVAKSGGKPLSRKSSSLDLGNLLSVSIYPSKGFDILREVKLLDDFDEIKHDYNSIISFMGLLEIIAGVAVAGEIDERLFGLYENLLGLIKQFPQKRDLLLRSFEIKLLHITGFGPELEHCVLCGGMLRIEDKRTVSSAGEVGYKCRKHYQNTDIFASDTVLKIQKFLKGHNIESSLALELNKPQLAELERIQTIWLEATIEKRINSKKILNK